MNNKGSKDASFWKVLYSGTVSSWDSYYGDGSGYGKNYYGDDLYPRKNKRRHSFSPILLVYSTVWNCEHCGAKKEDCLTDYCEDKDELAFGDWG